jgi:glycolate oxidase
LLWKGRKEAFGALGRISPMYYVQDGVIPRTRLPEMLRRISEISRKYDLQIGNIFHAGDGNLHPLILFDERDRAQFEKVVAAGTEIMQHCVAVGGALTGEHGIGMEKNELMSLIFSPDDLALMARVRAAFNPAGRLNPGKVLPLGKACGEIRIPHIPAPAATPA